MRVGLVLAITVSLTRESQGQSCCGQTKGKGRWNVLTLELGAGGQGQSHAQ